MIRPIAAFRNDPEQDGPPAPQHDETHGRFDAIVGEQTRQIIDLAVPSSGGIPQNWQAGPILPVRQSQTLTPA